MNGRTGADGQVAETWTVSKQAAISEHGIVAAQHVLAARAGAAILAAGGNAIDAAVATAFALAVVEPWNSGLGGGGHLVWADAATGATQVVDFAASASARVDPARYPIVGESAGSAFGWPRVEADRNVTGYEAICVPGAVDGLGLALERFGTLPLADALGPAIALAERGLPVDWYATLNIARSASALAAFAASRDAYLVDGRPPAAGETYAIVHLARPTLAATLRRLADAGRRDFYEGELAAALAADLREGGSVIDAADLASYRARLVAPATCTYRGHDCHGVPGLSGGELVLDGLRRLEPLLAPGARAPDAASYVAYAETLRGLFVERLARTGHAGPSAHTTHLSVVDRAGNMVALTTTLGVSFGSKVVLPRTGITMNSSMNNFDPRPGRANSIAPGRQPLFNMAPTIIMHERRPWAALGACGGRRIMPAVLQLTSFLIDHAMPIDDAFAAPRLDVGEHGAICDARLPEAVRAALAARMPLSVAEDGVGVGRFAVPCGVTRDATRGLNAGMAHILSPTAAAIAAG